MGYICPKISPRCPKMSKDDPRWPNRCGEVRDELRTPVIFFFLWFRIKHQRYLSARSGTRRDLIFDCQRDEIRDKYVRSDYRDCREIGGASRSKSSHLEEDHPLLECWTTCSQWRRGLAVEEDESGILSADLMYWSVEYQQYTKYLVN